MNRKNVFVFNGYKFSYPELLSRLWEKRAFCSLDAEQRNLELKIAQNFPGLAALTPGIQIDQFL